MAKKRLKLKDKQGNVIDYDISAASVTIDAEGKSVQVKIAELVEAIAEAVKTVVYNGEQHIVNNGRVDIGNQMQSDWSESSQSYPTFIKNKPNVVTGIKVGASGSTITPTNGVVTLPEISSQPECDTAMSSTSEAPVQNKVIKAYVDNLINGLINGAPQALDTLKELADALSDNDDAVAALTTLIDTKQGLLTFDNAPTENSNNPVKSGGVYDAIEDKLTSVTVNSIPSGEVQIVDDLETDDATKVLSAKQGKVLNDRLEDVEENGAGGVVYDSLASNSSGAALSARQGKLIYDNIMRIMSSLRPSAFWDNQAPALDWAGDVTKYNVTYQLSNCSAGSSATQVADGGTLIVELTPNTGYTLQGVNPSVSNGSSAVEHTKSYNATTGKLTITVRNVTSTITISASAIVLRTVTFNSQSLTWGGPTSVPNGGTLTGKVLATGNYALPSTAPTVSGTHGTVTWDNIIGDLTVANVTANLTISAEGVAGHSVSATIIDPTRNVATNKATLDNTNGVSHGGTYNGQLTIADGWNIDSVTVEMGGVEVQGAYNSTDNAITVNNVTADITIAVEVTSIMRIARGRSLNIYCQPANENFASFDGNKCYTDYLKFNIKPGDIITWHTKYNDPNATMAAKGNLGLYDKNKDVLYKLNDVEPYGYSTYSMSNGQRVFTVPDLMLAALNAANGTSGEEAEMYFRASMLMNGGDIDSGCYFSQERNGVEIARYNAELGLSEANDVLHTVTINHIKSDNTQVEITNSGNPYSGTEINVAHTNAAHIHDFFHGKTLKVKLTAKSGFTRTSVVVMRGDNDVTSTAFNPSTGIVSVEVTDDVVITVTTTANS